MSKILIRFCRVMSFMLCAQAIAALPSFAGGIFDELRGGIEWQYVRYNEPGVMHERGSLFGVYGSWDICVPPAPRLQLSGSYVKGDLVYAGSRVDWIGQRTAITMDTPNQILSLKLVSGVSWHDNLTRLDFIPYFGGGYRFLVDHLPTVWGYRREQTYWYLPVGVKCSGGMGGWGRWGAALEYDFLLEGHNRSDQSVFRQGRGYGLFGALSIEREGKDGSIAYGIQPYMQYWSLERSTVSFDGYVEPKNRSTAFGIRVLMEF